MTVWWWSAAAAQVVELPEEEALASVRLRSIGGAITGIAESASANLYNPAAIAMRRPLATQQAFDPDLALQARSHPRLTQLGEWLGSEPPVPRRSSYAQVAANVRSGHLAFAAGWRETSVRTEDDEVGTFLLSPGVGGSTGEWAVGLLPHVLGFRAEDRGASFGGGATAGALWAPAESRWRLGGRARTPIRTGALEGEGASAGFLPAEAALGASLGLGLANTPGTYGPDRRRAERPAVGLLSADLVWTGSSGEAVVLAPTSDAPAPSGWTLAGHAGAELWAAEDRLRLRTGAGWLPGRGPEAPTPYGAFGASWQVIRDPRGFGWRAVVGGEWYATGPAVGFGLETW